MPSIYRSLIIATLCLVGACMSCQQPKSNAGNPQIPATASEKNLVTFFLAPTGEQIEVPKKLQKILAERFTNPENSKRFPKTALRVIGYFHYSGEIWEWCGGRLHAIHGAYHYVPELDFPKNSNMYAYLRTPRLNYKPTRCPYNCHLSHDALRKSVKRHFAVYE